MKETLPKLGIIGSENFYVNDYVNNLKNHFEIFTVIIKKSHLKSKIETHPNLHINYLPKQGSLTWLNPINWIKIIRYMRKIDKKADGHILFFLTPYFCILVILGILKKPKYHLSFGSDVRSKGFKKFLVKRALKRIKHSFVEFDRQKDFISKKFNLPDNKVISKFIIWSVNPNFKRFNKEKINRIRDKWSIQHKYIIFSPRSTKQFYQHDLLIRAIGTLNQDLKREILIVLPGLGDKTYRKYLKQLAKENDVYLLNMEKILSPQEMAEIYNISLINVNIPENDQFGLSIIEGTLCGSIPLLAEDVENYHEYCKDMENCVFVKRDEEDIAKKITKIIDLDSPLQEKIYKNNLKIFEQRKDKSGNFKLFADFIKEDLSKLKTK
jgi:glycosyltransferase involved in cell wall biosynthesis